MELWDTVTNEMTNVSHPPGFEDLRFFKPSMATYDDNSIIVTGAELYDDDNNETFMTEVWKYTVGSGWTDLGEPLPTGETQYDIYMLDNTALGAYDSLTRCVC